MNYLIYSSHILQRTYTILHIVCTANLQLWTAPSCLTTIGQIQLRQLYNLLLRGEYSSKHYTQFVPGTSYLIPGQLGFDTSAHCSMVFEDAQLINLVSSPVLALFFSDASFSGQHMTHLPTYRKTCYLHLYDYISLIRTILIICCQRVCSICMRTRVPIQLPGFQLAGFPVKGGQSPQLY